MKVNVGARGGARLIMRNRGNFRLLLNANIWPGMTVTPMDGGKVAGSQLYYGPELLVMMPKNLSQTPLSCSGHHSPPTIQMQRLSRFRSEGVHIWNRLSHAF